VCDSSTDPTSSDFDPVDTVTTIGTGGLNKVGEAIYEEQKDLINKPWDKLTGKEQQEAMEEALRSSNDAQMHQIAFMREQYGDITEGLKPFREAGESFLPQLQEMLSPEARQDFISNYLQGDEFQQYQSQATDQLLQSAAATGGLGSSGTQDRIARESMRLGNQLGGQAYQSALGNLMTGANLGLGTYGTQLQAQGQLNQGVNQSLGNIAQTNLGMAGMQTSPLQQLLPLAQTGAMIYGAS